MTRVLVAALALAMGLGLLWLSGPRLIGALAMLPGDAIKAEYLPNLLAGREPYPSITERQVWRDGRLAALKWIDDPAAWGDLALLEMLEARQAPDRTQRREHLEAAREAVLQSLAVAPANGFMWLRLAAIEMRLDSAAETVLSALENSIRVAPYEPSAFQLRLAIGFHHWEATSVRLREQLREQLVMLPAARKLRVLQDLLLRYPARAADVREVFPESDWVRKLLERLELDQTTSAPVAAGGWA